MAENAEPVGRPHDKDEPSVRGGKEVESDRPWWLSVDPLITVEEARALSFLSINEVWEHCFEPRHFGIWTFERLDRRDWLHARQVRVVSNKNQSLRYEPVGSWFYPTRNRVTDGREDWPSIWTHFKYGDPTADQRIYSQFALTSEGRKAAKSVDFDRITAPGPLESVANSLEEISAEWRRGDCEMMRWLFLGPETSAYQKIMGTNEGERAIVRAIVKDLRVQLIPAVANMIDVPLRDDLRSLVRDLDPEQFCVDELDGEERRRWRFSWDRLNCQSRVDEIVALIRAREKSNQCDSTADPSSLITPVSSGESGPLIINPPRFAPEFRCVALAECRKINKLSAKEIEEDERAIAAFLAMHRRATRDEVSKATLIPAGTVSNSTAWKSFKRFQRSVREQNRVQGSGGVSDPTVDLANNQDAGY